MLGANTTPKKKCTDGRKNNTVGGDLSKRGRPAKQPEEVLQRQRHEIRGTDYELDLIKRFAVLVRKRPAECKIVIDKIAKAVGEK